MGGCEWRATTGAPVVRSGSSPTVIPDRGCRIREGPRVLVLRFLSHFTGSDLAQLLCTVTRGWVGVVVGGWGAPFFLKG